MSEKWLVIEWTDETKSEIGSLHVTSEDGAIGLSDHFDDAEIYNSMIKIEFVDAPKEEFGMVDEKSIKGLNDLLSDIIKKNQEDF